VVTPGQRKIRELAPCARLFSDALGSFSLPANIDAQSGQIREDSRFPNPHVIKFLENSAPRLPGDYDLKKLAIFLSHGADL
jgi:hypothetical protein